MTELNIIDMKAVTPAEQAQKLIKLKELKSQVDARLKEINESLLASMSELGVLNLKTEEMTITRAKRTTVSVSDMGAMKSFFEDKGLEFNTEEVVDKTTLNVAKAMVKDKQVVDGTEVKETEYITIRIAK